MAFAMPERNGATRVLVIDSEDASCRAWSWILPKNEFSVFLTKIRDNSADLLENFDVVIADFSHPPLSFNVAHFLSHCRCEWLAMVSAQAAEEALQALKSGAFDYVVKPFSELELCIQKVRNAARVKRIRDENETLRCLVDGRPRSPVLESQCSLMKPVIAQIAQLSQSQAPFALVGAPGLGKRTIARLMHEMGLRRKESFVIIDGESTDEKEIFGTSAERFMGAMFRANKGCLLIAHLERISLELQNKIAEALEKNCSSLEEEPQTPALDFRFCATCSWPLKSLLEAHRLAQSMYDLLCAHEIAIPTLAQRREDIPRWVYEFLRYLSPLEVKSVSMECMSALVRAPWRGQLLELEQVLAIALQHQSGNELKVEDLPEEFHSVENYKSHSMQNGENCRVQIEIDLDLPFRDAQLQVDRAFKTAYLKGILEKTSTVSAAARAAQMDRANFRRLLKKYHILHEP